MTKSHEANCGIPDEQAMPEVTYQCYINRWSSRMDHAASDTLPSYNSALCRIYTRAACLWCEEKDGIHNTE
jgi:hypothetical protein